MKVSKLSDVSDSVLGFFSGVFGGLFRFGANHIRTGFAPVDKALWFVLRLAAFVSVVVFLVWWCDVLITVISEYMAPVVDSATEIINSGTTGAEAEAETHVGDVPIVE